MIKNFINSKIGIIFTLVFVFALTYGGVALADVIIQGGNNIINENSESENFIAGGSLTPTGGICTGLGDPVDTLCNISINYLDVRTNLVTEGTLEVVGATTMDGDVTLTDSSNQTEYFYKVIDFTDNTTTPVIWSSNDDSYNDFYLMDMWVENTSKATSTPRVCVSTTTAGTVFAQDDATLLTDDAGACTLMRTLGDAFGADGAAFDGDTATSSMFSIWKYPGTNTDVINNNPGILINSTTDIFVRATSTTDYITGLIGADTSDGKLHIIGRESNR